ncbi:hypothetical protein ACIQVT_18275 [Streptomyces sp. NPDC100445]|uniref:hypothetical protein n=1 Tax=Streptomyces sp. NPDC100445 TaxID=3366102 RepID=UPI003822C187
MKLTKNTKAPAAGPPAAPGPNYASKSVTRHLVRGVIGFGLVIGSIAMIPVVGPVSLVVAPLALVAFRGCPTCWMVGLAQTISRGRLERECVDGVCTLTRADPAKKAEDGPSAGVTVPAHLPVSAPASAHSERSNL